MLQLDQDSLGQLPGKETGLSKDGMGFSYEAKQILEGCSSLWLADAPWASCGVLQLCFGTSVDLTVARNKAE